MFLIRTRVAPSRIHGIGVYADEPVEAGVMIWRYDPVFDRVISQEHRVAAPEAVGAFLDAYAYPAAELGGALVLSGDHARFLNHSDDPNTGERPLESFACRAIAAGEEITCDYRAFCEGWEGFGPAPPLSRGGPKAVSEKARQAWSPDLA